MKKAGCFCLALLLLVFSAMPVRAQATDTGTDLSVMNGCNSLDAMLPVLGTGKLITNAEAVFLYEINTQTLMYSWNADATMYPSSLVKILTALIAIEKGNLGTVVTAKEDVLSTVPYDAVSAELQAGEQMSLENLLYCMMVDSANDAAAVIADHISGSQSAFVEIMNQYAQQIGCTGTNFVNVHGLHDDAQITTARDVAKILAKALENETFQKIFSTVYYTVPATNLSAERSLASGNFMMNSQDGMEIYHDARVTGGRTGVADNGGRCLAVTAESNGLSFISVMMGSKSVYEEDGYTVRSFGGFAETAQLLDFGFDGFQPFQVLYENQILRRYSVTGGSSDVSLGTKTSAFAVLPAGTKLEELTFTYTDTAAELTAAVEQNSHLSTVSVWYKNYCIAQADLYAMNAVPKASSPIPQQTPLESEGGHKTVITVAVILLIIVLGGFIVLQISRRMRLSAARNRSRRHRRNRRRIR